MKEKMIREHNGIKYEVLQRFHPIHNNYLLLRDYTTQTAFYGRNIDTALSHPECPWLKLTPSGLFTIRNGYPWDGPSGPTWDTRPFMRPSLGHDGKYNLMRLRELEQWCRYQADFEMRRDCREDLMFTPRRVWAFHGVRLGAGFAAKPIKEIL